MYFAYLTAASFPFDVVRGNSRRPGGAEPFRCWPPRRPELGKARGGERMRDGEGGRRGFHCERGEFRKGVRPILNCILHPRGEDISCCRVFDLASKASPYEYPGFHSGVDVADP